MFVLSLAFSECPSFINNSTQVGVETGPISSQPAILSVRRNKSSISDSSCWNEWYGTKRACLGCWQGGHVWESSSQSMRKYRKDEETRWGKQ